MGGGRRGDKRARSPSSLLGPDQPHNGLSHGTSPTFKVKISQSGRVLSQLVAIKGGNQKNSEQKKANGPSSVPAPNTSTPEVVLSSQSPAPPPSKAPPAANLLPRVGSVKANGKAPAGAVGRGGKVAPGRLAAGAKKKGAPQPLRPVMSFEAMEKLTKATALENAKKMLAATRAKESAVALATPTPTPTLQPCGIRRPSAPAGKRPRPSSTPTPTPSSQPPTTHSKPGGDLERSSWVPSPLPVLQSPPGTMESHPSGPHQGSSPYPPPGTWEGQDLYQHPHPNHHSYPHPHFNNHSHPHPHAHPHAESASAHGRGQSQYPFRRNTQWRDMDGGGRGGRGGAGWGAPTDERNVPESAHGYPEAPPEAWQNGGHLQDMDASWQDRNGPVSGEEPYEMSSEQGEGAERDEREGEGVGDFIEGGGGEGEGEWGGCELALKTEGGGGGGGVGAGEAVGSRRMRGESSVGGRGGGGRGGGGRDQWRNEDILSGMGDGWGGLGGPSREMQKRLKRGGWGQGLAAAELARQAALEGRGRDGLRSGRPEVAVFVGDMDPLTSGAELAAAFGRHGEVVAANVIDGQCYGFVTFSDTRAAEAAVGAADRGEEVVIRGVKVRVSRARGSLPEWQKGVGGFQIFSTGAQVCAAKEKARLASLAAAAAATQVLASGNLPPREEIHHLAATRKVVAYDDLF